MKISFSAVFILLATVSVLFSQAVLILNSRSSMSGYGTFYDIGVGSCGGKNSDDEMVAALSIDACPDCSKDDVDMSKSTFIKVADLKEGCTLITWSF
ncbi:MAG: hypothetical protein EXX96DRAFT_654241 [Benjaminiella poitrasii]|nr:MAG: hypothetical protein EXX96DRAFT_654241 [Benjaminiella poitrasii]